MRGIYPDKDINNIDALIDLGESLHLKMPSRDGTSEEDEAHLKDIAILLTSSKRIKMKKEDEIELEIKDEPIDKIEPVSTLDDKASEDKNSDRMIVDHGGNTHYIGPLGAPLMATTVFALLLRNSTKNNLLSMKRAQNEEKEGIINSKQAPLNAFIFRSLDLENFPLLNLLNRQELDLYVKIFFEKIHPVVYCFQELEFMKCYEVFWSMINSNPVKKLSNSQVCCIYMVWILAKQVTTSQDGVMLEFDDFLINRYIDVIKLTLSEMLLTPNLDGIRCLILLSIYMDNNKRRESGYVLIELLLRQAISIGLNRKSLTAYVKNDLLIEGMKRTWWVLFKHELRFSNQMGRPTCLQIEDINVDHPQFDDSTFQTFVEEEIKLNKIMYGVLHYRKTLLLNYELLSLVNMEKLINLKKTFNQWYQELPASMRYDLDPTLYKCGLHLHYHYYMITLSLPFILYCGVHSNLKLSSDDPIVDLICQCVKSSILIAQIMTFIDNNGFFNGTIYVDLFFCYHGCMALVIFSLLLHQPTPKFDLGFLETHYGITVATVDDSLQLIKILNSKNTDLIQGSLITISELIEIMIADLDIILRSRSSAPQLDFKPETPQLPPQLSNAIQMSPFNYPDFGRNLSVNDSSQDFSLNFSVDNQMMLDNDMIDLLFGGDLLSLYNVGNSRQA